MIENLRVAFLIIIFANVWKDIIDNHEVDSFLINLGMYLILKI